MIGKVVSHYEIVGPLGAGGMGIVYKGHDRRLDRFVALKFLPPEVSANEEMKARFINEARAASALDHSSICTIHEIDETAEGQLFIVMAFYEGESLRQRLQRGRLAMPQVVDLGSQVAEGLRLAHEAGILHRDIKPANIFITRRGEAKILDFGLAKIAGSARMTRTGASMGTLNYMCPEQLRGQPVDGRADIWALGAVLWEMSTGRTAFGGDNEGAIVYNILHVDLAPPSSLFPDIPSAFDELVRGALARGVESRTADMESLCRQLAGVGQAARLQSDPPTLLADDDQPTLVQRVPAVAEADKSVAVFNFSNITRDPAAEWLSVGIAETLTVDLKKVASLRVASRQKIHKILDVLELGELGDDELLELGRSVGARWLISGAYQRHGEAIRITTRCFDVSRGRTVEALKLDGTMSEIFSLQDRILEALLQALQLEMSESEKRQIERPETLDLEAYEYCAKARELVYRMKPEGLVEAGRHLHRAIELDSDYALAYSSLGQLHCFRFIATTDEKDLEIAIGHLKRAVELDPELADPYGWLSYAYSRAGQHEAAIASGRRAVELEPDNPQSHYFLAVALWLLGMDEYDTRGYGEALEHLQQVTALAPRYQPGFQIQGGIYLQVGLYAQARRCLEVAAEIEESGEFELGKFVGAIGALARVAFRQGRLREASRLLDKAFEVSGDTDHVYTPACNALAHCWRGDILLRQRQREEALRAFRAARDQVLSSPRSLGIGWPLLRSHLGMARCFHDLRMRREAAASYAQASSLLESKEGYDFSGLWDCGDAQIHAEMAACLAATRRVPEALAALEKAMSCGWMDAARLAEDPDFEILRSELRFRELQAGLTEEQWLGVRSLPDQGRDA